MTLADLLTEYAALLAGVAAWLSLDAVSGWF